MQRGEKYEITSIFLSIHKYIALLSLDGLKKTLTKVALYQFN